MRIAFRADKDPGLFAQITMRITKSEWSHVLLILDQDVEDDLLTAESDWNGGARLGFWSKSQHKKYEVFEFDDEKVDALIYIKDRMGKVMYAYGMIVGYPIEHFFGKAVAQKVARLIQKALKIIKIEIHPFEYGEWCSEFVLHYLISIPHLKKMFDGLDPNTATPEQLYQIIKSNSSIFTLVDASE